MRGLLVQLRMYGLRELRQIADCWDVALTGHAAADHVAQLYRAMRDPWTARDRAEVLSAVEWAIIEASLNAPDGLRSGELPDITGHAAEEVNAAVVRLQQCGILAEERAGTESALLTMPRELITAFGRIRDERSLGGAIGPETPLRALLTTLEGGELEEAAQVWGIRVTPGTIDRETLIDEVLARVDLPEQRRAVIRTMSAEAARVFAAVREAEGEVAVATLRERLHLAPPAMREALRPLNRALLVWHTWGSDAAPAGERLLIVPRDVLTPRRHPRDAPPPLEPVNATPSACPSFHFSAAWDLLTILQRLESGALIWRAADEERNATSLRRLASALWLTGDEGRARPGYVPLLLGLARQADLLRVADEHFLANEATIESWRSRSFAEQTQALFACWCGAPEWLEGAVQEDLQLAGVDWPAARKILLAALRECAPDTWYDATTLALRIARLEPHLLGGKFSAARASGPAGTREDVTAAAVSVALLGALVPLGLVREGQVEGKRDRPAIMLSAVGGWLLGQGAAPDVPALADRPISVGADFEILLFRPTPRRLWALSAMAEPAKLDTVSIFQLTEGSVRQGIAAGLTAEQIVAFLERAGGEPLPQNVAFALREWTRGHFAVRLARAFTIRLDSPDAVERLRAATARVGLAPPEELAERRYLVTLPHGADPEAFLEALRLIGLAIHWQR